VGHRALNAPTCPACESKDVVVLGRFTSQDDDFVRMRKCRDCNYQWSTVQPPEEVLDESIRIIFNRWTSPAGKERRVTLEYASKTR